MDFWDFLNREHTFAIYASPGQWKGGEVGGEGGDGDGEREVKEKNNTTPGWHGEGGHQPKNGTRKIWLQGGAKEKKGPCVALRVSFSREGARGI